MILKIKGLTSPQLGFKRELKSFDLRFNWVPFGRNQRWDFFIGINSSMLSDLNGKVEAKETPRLGDKTI